MSQALGRVPTEPTAPATQFIERAPKAARELPDELSARTLLSRGQVIAGAVTLAVIAGILGLPLATGVGPSPREVAVSTIAVATVAYLVVIAFRLVLVTIAQEAPVMRFTPAALGAVSPESLPVYSVLVPIYREDKVLRALLSKLSALDYPADRLQVLLLIEEDDELTRTALAGTALDARFEVVLIPPSQPRTKPKACNVGLAYAQGEFCVIYDAEDRPEPDQLRKAVAAFRSLPNWVVCVQAELQYWNPWTNWLTRCFAAEYAL